MNLVNTDPRQPDNILSPEELPEHTPRFEDPRVLERNVFGSERPASNTRRLIGAIMAFSGVVLLLFFSGVGNYSSAHRATEFYYTQPFALGTGLLLAIVGGWMTLRG